MSLTSVQSPVTNGELLGAVLSAMHFGHLNGQNELCTTSVKSLTDMVIRYLCDQRGISWGWMEEDAYLTHDKLQQSVVHLLAQLKATGIMRDWQGEVRHYKHDPERLCLAEGYDVYDLLDRLLSLVKAQTNHPEFPKSVQTFGTPSSLLANRALVRQALTSKGEELRRLSHGIYSYLDLFDPDTSFSPRDSREYVLYASYHFVWLILRLRAKKPRRKNKQTPQRWEALPITPVAAAKQILELQTIFVQNRALWWILATNALVAQRNDIKKEIWKRRHEVAARAFYNELNRQKALRRELRRFNRETGGRLRRFIHFEWLNTPFSQWDKPSKPDERFGIVLTVPSFKAVS